LLVFSIFYNQIDKKAEVWAGEALDNLELDVGYDGTVKSLGDNNPFLMKHNKAKGSYSVDFGGMYNHCGHMGGNKRIISQPNLKRYVDAVH